MQQVKFPSQKAFKQEPIGTIVRRYFKEFKDWYEGEVTGFDAKHRLYKIKYLDGDEEEMDADDLSVELIANFLLISFILHTTAVHS